MTRQTRILMIAVAIMAVVAITVTAVFVTPPLFHSIKNHVTRDDAAVTITSPGGKTAFVLTVRDGRLTYRVERDNKTFLCDSPMGVTLGADAYGELTSIDQIGDIQGRIATEERAILGRTAKADAPCVQATVAINADPAFTLETWIFDNGVAFRYLLPDNGHRSLKSEETGFVVPADTAVWAGDSHKYYESAIQYHSPAKATSMPLGTPVTLKIDTVGYAAVLEGDLREYPGLKLAWQTAHTYSAVLGDGTATLSGDITTPWRIVSVADDLNELVNNTIVYQVCDPADRELYDGWVKPGRATWSWITGRTTDAVTPAVLEEYTADAARLGFEYNIIDEGWIHWNGSNRRIDELCRQGEAYGVGQILWTGVNAGASFRGGIDTVEDAKAFLDFLDEHDLAGGKIDFFPEESNVDMGVNVYREILSYAAEKELVINFHGCNKPSGYDVTYPNELNREAILGFESTTLSNRRVQAQMFVTQPFVRNLAGHADYTPAVDTAFHMAQLVLTDAPMQAIGTDPKRILASPAREMIKSVPTVWNQTTVLSPSTIGQDAVMARQASGGSWYVGGINATADGDTLTLDLSEFLESGTYRCELWTDKGQTPVCDISTVTADDTLTVPFAALSGFIARFDRVTLSQYGGEITDPVTVDIADPDTTVSYAFDNGDKRTAFHAIASGDTIPLTESGLLILRVTGGPDKGREISYRFNRLQP